MNYIIDLIEEELKRKKILEKPIKDIWKNFDKEIKNYKKKLSYMVYDHVIAWKLIDTLEWNKVEKGVLSIREWNIMEEKEVSNITEKPGKWKIIILQTIFWVILIIISIAYLIKSPAEQKVLSSGMSIWVSKIKTFVYQLNTWLKEQLFTDYIRRKHDMIENIDTLIIWAQACIKYNSWIDLKEDINKSKLLKENIKAVSTGNFIENYDKYNAFLFWLKETIKTKCK